MDYLLHNVPMNGEFFNDPGAKESESTEVDEKVISYLRYIFSDKRIEEISDEDIIAIFVESITHYAEANMYGIHMVVLNELPAYIESLLPQDRIPSALLAWEDFVRDFKQRTDSSTKIPRKIKKTLKKPQSARRPNERGRADRFAKRNRS